MSSVRAWALVVVVGLGASEILLAQEGEKLKVRISYKELNNKESPVKLPELSRIVLRPNMTQPVYLYVENPSQDTKKNVKFKLERLVGGKAFRLQETIISVIKSDETVPVLFGNGAPQAKPDKNPDKTEPGKTPPPWPSVDGPPFLLRVSLEEDKAGKPTVIGAKVELLEPHEYVSIGDGMKYNSKTNRLSVNVKALANFAGPPCTVQIVLSPDLLPGLVLAKTGGVFEEELTEAGQQVELAAPGLRFTDAPPKNGRVHLTVDGYERAFTFNTNLAEGTLQLLDREHRIRIHAPRYAQPGPKFPVRLEVDGPPSARGERIELGVDRSGDDRNFRTRTFKGLRQQKVQVGTNEHGMLEFRTEVTDWRTELNTKGVFGKRLLRARLLDGHEKKEDEEVQPLADERATIALFRPGLTGPWAPLTFADNAVFAEVVLDNTEAKDLRVEGVPATLPQGQDQTIKVKAKFEPRSEDQAPVTSVRFFLGKAVDGKVPEGAVDGKRVAGKGEVWEAEVFVPGEKRDRIDVSALATTVTGVSTESSVKSKLVDSKSDPNKKGAAKITGTVREGTLAQPNLTVTLRDAKGMPKTTAKTNADGVYVFENVPPGTYSVYAARSVSRTSGQTAVSVPEGKEIISKVDIKLFR